MRFTIKALLAFCFLLPLCAFYDEGCSTESQSDHDQRVRQEQMSQNANAQVGMPGISNFTEKKIMRRLYEMRDQNVMTYTYMIDLNGHLHHVCDSYGFGLPYGTQFSSPQKLSNPGNSNILMPQSEPNGLWVPETAEGTWVICASTKGEFTPMYIEPRVIVSPFRLNAVDDYALAGNTNDALTKQELHSDYKPAVK